MPARLMLVLLTKFCTRKLRLTVLPSLIACTGQRVQQSVQNISNVNAVDREHHPSTKFCTRKLRLTVLPSLTACIATQYEQ
jgi:hypothetical protein